MIARAARGVWGFVVGDDWRVALWVVLALAATAVIAKVGWPAWWVTPIATLAVLRASVRRASRPAVVQTGRPAPAASAPIASPPPDDRVDT